MEDEHGAQDDTRLSLEEVEGILRVPILSAFETRCSPV
jgi:hypothetical protein